MKAKPRSGRRHHPNEKCATKEAKSLENNYRLPIFEIETHYRNHLTILLAKKCSQPVIPLNSSYIIKAFSICRNLISRKGNQAKLSNSQRTLP